MSNFFSRAKGAENFEGRIPIVESKVPLELSPPPLPQSSDLGKGGDLTLGIPLMYNYCGVCVEESSSGRCDCKFTRKSRFQTFSGDSQIS